MNNHIQFLVIGCGLDWEIIDNEELDYFDVKTLRRNSDTGVDVEKKISGRIVEKNDLVILVDGENSGEVFKIPYRGYMGSTFKKLKFNTEEIWNYISMFLRKNKEVFKNNKVGSAIPHLNKKLFKEFEFPLPSLNEQKRIVEKLDFLFEKTKRAKEIIEEIKVDIENRKISILDRAFKGTLTSKWRNENKTSDVKELLKSINDEKIKKWEEDCLQAEKDGNKKPKKPIIKEVKDMIVPVDEQPYKLPDSWVWVRLGDIEEIKMGQSPKGEEISENGLYSFIGGPADMGDDFPKIKRFTDNSTRLSEYGDLIISVRATIGKTNISDKSYCLGRGVCAVSTKNIKINFLRNYIFSITNYLYSMSTGTTFSQISKEDIIKICFPLPPLEEQQEIVRVLDGVLENENKVKELLELEERIEILEKSILHKAFKGELGTQNSSDESALNLLKSLL